MKKVAEKLIMRQNKKNDGKNLNTENNKILKLGNTEDKNSKSGYIKGKIGKYAQKCEGSCI